MKKGSNIFSRTSGGMPVPAGKGLRFALYVHHDDADREWAYDRDSLIGRLSRGLDEAAKRGWIVVSMKNDWRKVFSFERE